MQILKRRFNAQTTQICRKQPTKKADFCRAKNSSVPANHIANLSEIGGGGWYT